MHEWTLLILERLLLIRSIFEQESTEFKIFKGQLQSVRQGTGE